MHTILENPYIIKIVKIIKAAPTCFCSYMIHHQGATSSAQLRLQPGTNVRVVIDVVSVMVAYSDLLCVCIHTHTHTTGQNMPP